jgi:hypothetical protein
VRGSGQDSIFSFVSTFNIFLYLDAAKKWFYLATSSRRVAAR